MKARAEGIRESFTLAYFSSLQQREDSSVWLQTLESHRWWARNNKIGEESVNKFPFRFLIDFLGRSDNLERGKALDRSFCSNCILIFSSDTKGMSSWFLRSAIDWETFRFTLIIHILCHVHRVRRAHDTLYRNSMTHDVPVGNELQSTVLLYLLDPQPLSLLYH